MEPKELEGLHQQIKSMQGEIDQQKNVINEYELRLKGIKGDLYSQEHRFINSWLNLLSHFKNKDKEHFKEKLSAVIQGFLPGAKSTIVIGGSIIGLLTVVLMYQNNQLMLLQNQYLQKQIYIQADSDRRDQLVNIMEKLYELSDDYIALTKTDIDISLLPRIKPKYTAQVRNESLITYINIKHNPLEQVGSQKLNSIQKVAFSLWGSIWESGEENVLVNEDSCENTNETALRSVVLERALLHKVSLDRGCLKRAFLKSAYLYEASLIETNLNGANLIRAKLEEADMTKAKMIGTELVYAKLKDAVLIGADLRTAILRNASLNGAALNGADLSGADLEGAILTEAIGLTCEQLISAKNWKLAVTDLTCEETQSTEQVEGEG